MNRRYLPWLLGPVGLAALLTVGWAQDREPAPQDNAEILARGPLHEAFAEPPDPTPAASPVIDRQPPDPINEIPPDEKPDGDEVSWIPGYWDWDDDTGDFLWISGIWREEPPG